MAQIVINNRSLYFPINFVAEYEKKVWPNLGIWGYLKLIFIFDCVIFIYFFYIEIGLELALFL